MATFMGIAIFHEQAMSLTLLETNKKMGLNVFGDLNDKNKNEYEMGKKCWGQIESRPQFKLKVVYGTQVNIVQQYESYTKNQNKIKMNKKQMK